MAFPHKYFSASILLIFLLGLVPLIGIAKSEWRVMATDNVQGRIYTLQLHASELLASRSISARHSSVTNGGHSATFYQGVVDNDANSWVRLTRTKLNHYSGLLYANNEWFDISGPINALTLNSVTESFQTSMREFTHGSPIDTLLFAPPTTGTGDARLRNSTRMYAPNESRAMKIGVVVDSLYDEFFSGNGLNNALAIINNVDGLYQAQFGLALIVENIRVYNDAETDPLRLLPNDLEILIDRYRQIRLNDSELRSDLGLVHVFSGHSNLPQAVGVGWIGTVCRQDGYNTSVSTPFTYATLLAAHEMAHNLGALHDSDPACEGAVIAGVDHIMSTEISTITQPVFSSCSIDSVLPSRDASCQFDNIDLRLELHSLSTDSTLEKLVSVQIQNLDSARAATDVVSRTMFPMNTSLLNASAGCTIEFSSVVCNHGRIDATNSSVISVLANFENSQSGVVTSSTELSTIADSNSTDNTDTVDIPFADGTNSGNTPDAIPTGGGASVQSGAWGVLELLIGIIALPLALARSGNRMSGYGNQCIFVRRRRQRH